MRKNSLLKKTAWIVLSAVLFGTVAGTVMTGVQIASSGMVSQFFAIVSSDEKLPEQGEELLPEPFPGGNIPGILPEVPAVPAPATDVSQVVEEAMPAVVAVASTAVYQMPDFGFGWFFGGGSQSYEVPSSGSGIIIGENDTELLIVTNNHVVQDTVSLKITFVDDTAVDAAVKGTDPDTDLAVISVPMDQIPQETKEKIAVARLGDSDGLKVGQGVIAIGNALGYGQSVTTGIVSAKNRRMDSDNNTVTDGSDDSSDGVNLIQTDAAINPGNSGGALLNMDGEVVGINSSKLASTEVEGMGYAIAISDVADSLENMMNAKARDKVDNHGILGITGSTVSTEAVQIYGIPQGVFVSKVTEGGPADDAGITKNMVITEFDGKTITSIDQLVELLQYYEPKEKIDVTVAVLDGNEYKEKTLTVKLGKDDSSSKDSKDSSEDSTSQDSQDADIPDIQGGQDDSDQGDADAFADDGEASLFRDFEQNGLYD